MWIKTFGSTWKNLDWFLTIKLQEIEDGFYHVYGIESNDQCHILGQFVTHEEAVEFVEKLINRKEISCLNGHYHKGRIGENEGIWKCDSCDAIIKKIDK
jgi:hypothetical protein